jgi:hypothetical protein
LGDLAAVLAWLPAAARGGGDSGALVQEGSELVVATLALLDALNADVALREDAAFALREVDVGAIEAWGLGALGEGDGRWLLRARRRDGQSPWQTDGDHLTVHHDRVELLTALLRRRLGPAAHAP